METKLEKMETVKVERELALTECQDELKASGDQLVELGTCLAMVNEARGAAEECQCKERIGRVNVIHGQGSDQNFAFESWLFEGRGLKREGFVGGSCGQVSEFGDEILIRMKCEVDIRNAAILNGNWKLNQVTFLLFRFITLP